MKNLPNLKKVLAALLTIAAVMVGHQAMADDKTVTYTISYTGTNTLTATPDVAGFDGSTEVITGPAITGSNDNFVLFLHDNLNVIFNLYQSSGNRRMYVSDDGVTFTFAANITTCCSNYYIKHIAMKDHNGTAIMVYDLNAYPPTNFSFDLDVDLDKLGASGAPTTVTEHHVRTANNTTTIKTITITYGTSPRSYNISYTNAVNGQNGVTNNNRTTYSVATPTFNVTAPTRTGYDFDGFTYTDAAHPTATNATLPMSISRGEAATRKAITFDASWTPITYSISYDLAGGSVATANPTTYTVETATFTLNNPTRTGYTFAGWTGTDLNGPTMTVTIAQGSIGDRSYTATWTPITYNISYDLAGGSVATANPTTYNIETATFTLNNPTRTGYTFAGWTGTDLNGPTMTVTIAQGSIGDRSYTATWTPITYNISYDLAGGSVATANPTTYNIETATFTLNNPTREGYTFAGWTGTDLNGPTMNVTIAQGSIGDRSYTATWTPITYNISYDLAGGSVATANPTTYNIETATFTLNNPTRNGYTFAGWTGTDLNGPTMNVTIAQGSIGDRSYTATWNIITYNLAYDLAGGSVATANPTTYTVETPDITLNNPTRQGYTFAGWTGTDLNGPTMNVTIAQGSIGDRSYTATWNIITYNLTYDLAGGSVATANPTTYTVETPDITLNNPTRQGYTFAGWTGTDLNGPTMNVTIAQGSIGDRSYTATWNIITYNLTYDLAGGSVATANPTTYNIETATFTLNNPTRTGYTFAGWTGTDLNEPTLTVTIAQGSIGDRSYTATWNTITYTITYNLAGGSVATANPTTYNIETATFTLNNPTRVLSTFAGWTGTDLDEPTMNVTIAQGSTGDRSYTATWSLLPVTYIDADGVERTLYDYTLLEGSDEYITYGNNNVEAWYVVAHDVTYSDGFAFRGSTNLILVDGATLTITNVSGNHSNVNCDNGTIYLQSGGTGAIVGENIQIYSYGSMTIHGGHITLSGRNYGLYSTDDITINGGQISIEAQWGCIYAEYDVTINGGVVSTTNQQGGYGICGNNSVTINGGVVTTTNQQGGYGIFSSGVTINGGVVTANAPNGGYGIRTQFSDLLITLGWTNETDRITSDSYYGTVTTVTGKAFTDGEGNYYAGTYYGNEISALAGKTLTPYTNLDEAFHITYVINGGTMPSGYPETYTFDETVTLPVPTKADNTFVGWYKDYYFNYDPITEIAAGTTLGDLTLYASWKPEKTWVDYLDADGQPQRAYATILYGGDEAEYPAGVYTLEEIIWGKSYGGGSYNRLNFTGDAILILPDYCSLSIGGERDNDGEDGLFVNGDLTIYGQTLGYNYCFASRIQASGNVAIYGGYLDIDNLSASNITLGWTGLENKYSFNQVAGNVTLANDFRLQNDQGTSVVHAGSITSSELEQASLYPYATTIEVSYMDENGDTQTVNATVLWGDETRTELSGGFYTILESVHIDHDLSFNGNTTLIVPSLYDFSLDGNLTVDGNLSVYGIGFFSIQDLEATGDVLFCIDDATNPSSTLTAGGNVFIAHGCFSANKIYGSTITLGYLYNNDYIRCGSNNQNGYFGNVVVREGQALQQGGNVYSGTLTAEQISAIKGKELKPYIPTMPTLAVTGYGESTESDHWVFIASPIMSFIDPYSVTNLIGGMSPSGQSNFDLYRFNQSAELEWENFYQHLTGGNSFALENGKGYLYANKNDVTLEFNGVVYPEASKEVSLDYDANAEFAGWNLVGNPFNAPATLNKSYYKMNSNGTGLVAEAVSGNTTIDACTGVIVKAEGEDETVLFTKSNAKGQQETGFGTLQIALTQAGTHGNALMDNAIVSFNEGDQLSKFYFGTQNANIYIPQGNKEYAIVSAGNTGEIPINFKAHENGEYTLTVSTTLNSQLSTINYLHLIDNLTGADVDLLQTPEYVFTAQTTDYKSRFKLVFSASANTDVDSDVPFAYYANGKIFVFVDAGTATLQVIDILGRELVRKELSTFNSQLSTLNYTPGVYVLRLINGDTIRTQKIVIE